MSDRKGAVRRADIPKDILRQLNQGTIEARTLAESLAIDFHQLLAHAIPGCQGKDPRVASSVGIVKRMASAGVIAWEKLGPSSPETLFKHPSDTVRGWGAYALAAIPDIPIRKRLRRIQPWADDPNSGVREWAWLAVRPYIAESLEDAIDVLAPWARSRSERIRRFASEATRPRGVWCSHLVLLKQSPEMALPILEPLKADTAKYVQDSVANWLNDAFKSKPEWVRSLCIEWRRKSPCPETERICKRALRSSK